MNINDIPTTVETLMAQTMTKISQVAANPNPDVGELEALTKRASELKQIKQQVAAIQQRLLSMNGGSDRKAPTMAHGAFQREVLIEVSQGMINQNLLTLTDALKHGQVKVGEEMIIEAMPSGERFKTFVMQNGNKVQERGAVGRFYREAGVRDGDFVILRETARGQWQLQNRASAGA